jgi:tRNA-specific 2-thiouridylase
VHRYTVGQRRGLGVTSARPLYVLAVLPASRTVVVGDADRLQSSGLVAREVNWLSIAPPAGARRADVKIRYRAAEAAATLRPQADGRVDVTFDAPQRAVTPGQAAVFYQGEVCLGGGWIESAMA